VPLAALPGLIYVGKKSKISILHCNWSKFTCLAQSVWNSCGWHNAFRSWSRASAASSYGFPIASSWYPWSLQSSQCLVVLLSYMYKKYFDHIHHPFTLFFCFLRSHWWIWWGYPVCMYGNITMKPLLQLIYSNKNAKEVFVLLPYLWTPFFKITFVKRHEKFNLTFEQVLSVSCIITMLFYWICFTLKLGKV
jgi:hypothetical protein